MCAPVNLDICMCFLRPLDAYNRRTICLRRIMNASGPLTHNASSTNFSSSKINIANHAGVKEKGRRGSCQGDGGGGGGRIAS